jgi:hypothetical protein
VDTTPLLEVIFAQFKVLEADMDKGFKIIAGKIES